MSGAMGQVLEVWGQPAAVLIPMGFLISFFFFSPEIPEHPFPKAFGYFYKNVSEKTYSKKGNAAK